MARVEWKEKGFDNDLTVGKMNIIDNKIFVSGKVKDTSYNKLLYWAPASPCVGHSFSGFGLPFANPHMAYENTQNRGDVNLSEKGGFSFTINYPNSYYVGLGTLYIPPHITLRLCGSNKCSEKTVNIKIDEGIPFRTLTYPAPPSKRPRNSPMFYASEWQGPRTQEQILYDSEYPKNNITPDNFWGKSVPK